MSGSPAVVSFVGRSLRALSAVAALVAPLAFATSVGAQTKEMTEFVNSEGRTEDLTPFRPDHPRKMNQLQGQLLQMLNIGKPSGPAEAANLEKLAWLHIAELTWPSGDASQGNEQRRFRTKTRLLMRPLGTQDDGQLPDAHDRVNAVMLKGLPLIIGDAGYSLNTRFNAILLLGELDKIEPYPNKGRVGVPMVEATPLLLKAYQTAEFGETLRIAALIGIDRHCSLQVAPADRPALAA